MIDLPREPSKLQLATVGGAVALFAVALLVRGLAPAAVVRPEDAPVEGPRLVEPMQFLGRGASLRIGELDEWVAPERRGSFKAMRELVFNLGECPELLSWIDSVDGQRCERLLAEMRRGKREEALAALALVFEIVRRTEWEPGIMTRTPEAGAERAAALFADWLRLWGEKGATDPVLAEPAVSAALLYGRTMHIAQNAPVIGTVDSSYQRGKAFLRELTNAVSSPRTKLGEALQARFPSSMTRLASDDGDDALRDFDREAKTLFPDIDGDCE